MLRALMFLANRVNLDNTSDVSILIARGKWASSYKANLCDFYQHYVKYNGIAWNKPKYRRDHKIPTVPTEEKLNLILGHASRKYALIYSIIKECGLRPIEISNLTLRDIDLEKGTVSVYSAKYGNPRILKLKPHTQSMLVEHVKRHSFNLNDRLFPKSSTISNTFERLRTSLAKKMHDSELKRIRLYDLRHYYASMLYYHTKDILLVKESLGHRNINNTLIYTHLIDFKDSDEWHSATAKTIEEATKLVESGFEYVTEMDGVKLFRKRK
jgi:integrase